MGMDKGKGDQQRKREDEGNEYKKGAKLSQTQKYEYFEQVAIGRYTLHSCSF
jgi:hypothetical protein